MDLLSLIRINKTVAHQNRLENRPEDSGLTKTVVDAATVGYNALKSGVKKGIVTGTALAHDAVAAGSKYVTDAGAAASKYVTDKATATAAAVGSAYNAASVNIKDLMSRLFSGDINDVCRYEAYAASIPAFTGELNPTEMAQLRMALEKLYPNTYTGRDVNDAKQIESEIIRPVSMILARQFGLPVMMLSSMLKMIAFYETSLKGSVARTVVANKPVGIFQYIPSVLARMEARLGKFVPGQVSSETTFATNYFGDILKTVTTRFKVEPSSDVPLPTIFSDAQKNLDLRAKLAVLPFSKNSKLNTVLLMMAIHRCGYNPAGSGYSISNLTELTNKRVPAFIQSFVETKSNKQEMYV